MGAVLLIDMGQAPAMGKNWQVHRFQLATSFMGAGGREGGGGGSPNKPKIRPY